MAQADNILLFCKLERKGLFPTDGWCYHTRSQSLGLHLPPRTPPRHPGWRQLGELWRHGARAHCGTIFHKTVSRCLKHSLDMSLALHNTVKRLSTTTSRTTSWNRNEAVGPARSMQTIHPQYVTARAVERPLSYSPHPYNPLSPPINTFFSLRRKEVS